MLQVGDDQNYPLWGIDPDPKLSAQPSPLSCQPGNRGEETTALAAYFRIGVDFFKRRA